MFATKPIALGIKAKDTFENLTVLGHAFCVGRFGKNGPDWMFVVQCKCGSIQAMRAKNLKSGNSTKCKACAHITHHGSKTRLYQCWADMMKRCYASEREDFGRYGAKGVTVCEEWHKFENFRDWALAHGYADHLTLDRFPDQEGNYEPGNCRWVTTKEQNNNQTTNRILTAFSESKTIAQWSEDPRCQVSYDCLRLRINRGISPEEAMTEPSKSKRN